MRPFHDTPKKARITSIDDLSRVLRAQSEDAAPAAARAHRPRVSLAGALGVGLVAILITALVWSVMRGGGTDPLVPGAGCAEVRVATTADFAPVVEAAIGRLEDVADGCTRYDVTTAPSAVTADAIGAGSDAPHVWIPDSSIWLARAGEGGEGPALTAGPILATTPVVLAAPGSLVTSVGTSAAQPWRDILGGPLEPRIDAPEESTPSLLVLASATEALRSTPEGERLLLASAIRMSRADVSEEVSLAQASDDAEGAGAVPATEQQIFRQRADDPSSSLSAVVPAEPMGVLSYSWVVVPHEQQSAATREAVELLGRSLTGVAGVADRQAAGFRTADGEDAPGVAGLPDTVTPRAERTLDEAEAALADWEAAQHDLRLLTVVDDSASMAEQVGDRTRAGHVLQGLTAALEILPSTSQVGYWSFSPGRAGDDVWTELAPVAPLDDSSAVLTAASAAPRDTEGGNGLYETVLAAYRLVQEEYDPGAVNAVVLVTDGRQDDAGPTLYQLLAELQASADPERPVPVYLIGVGDEVYEHELRLISELTGGRHYVATDPDEISLDVVDALIRHFRAE